MIETQFKHTEIGLIPHDWEVKSLGDIGEIRMCKRVMKYQTSQMGDIPFFKIGTFGKEADAYISRALFEEFRRLYNYPQKGDILLSAAGTIGRTVVFDGKDSYFQDSNIVWLENKEKILRNSLLYYIYQTIKWVTDTGTIPRIYNDVVRKIFLAFPPTLAEQERIADALSKIDSLIVGLDELLEKKRAIKTGTMQQLLTGKKRLQGFTGEWKSVNLGDVIKVRNGYPFESATYSEIGTYKIVTIANVQNGRLDLSSYNIISSLPKNIQPCQILRIGDILISMTGNVGRICKVTEKNCLLNQRVGLLQIVSKKIDEDFLYVVLNNVGFEKAMIEKGQGAAQSNIGNKDIENYVFNCPPTIEEQQAIANILSSMDTEIASLEQKRDKYIAMKQGMMQQLLTGKIRLV